MGNDLHCIVDENTTPNFSKIKSRIRQLEIKPSIKLILKIWKRGRRADLFAYQRNEVGICPVLFIKELGDVCLRLL